MMVEIASQTPLAMTGTKLTRNDKTRITPEMARVEEARRELAKRSYVDFRHYMAPWYVDAPHNVCLARELEEVEKFIASGGKEGNGRLIVLMPPQYGKSNDGARLFPAWVLGRNPNRRIAITSYASSLSDGHSGAVRNYVQSQRYQNVFGETSTVDTPVGVADDSASKSDWDIAEPHRGGCVSRGIGGGLSGKGADLLIIDDPTKDIEEARSDVHQKKVLDWFESVAYQRLSHGGAIVIIQTRWDPDDLVGQLLKKMGSDDPNAEQWKFVFLPALALEADEYPTTMEQFKENLLRGVCIPIKSENPEDFPEEYRHLVFPKGDQLGRNPGEALWEWKYSKLYIEKKKSNLSAYVFSSLDQQLPRAFSGGMFDESDIQIMATAQVPPKLRWFAYVDLALGKNTRSDFNAVMPVALSQEPPDFIGRDLYREQALNKFLKNLKKLMLDEVNKGVTWGIESTAFQTLIFEKFRGDPELAMMKILEITPSESKEDRAEAVSLRGKEKHLWLVKGEWNRLAIRELTFFPHGKHDDVVDTMSGGLLMIAKYSKDKHLESKIL